MNNNFFGNKAVPARTTASPSTNLTTGDNNAMQNNNNTNSASSTDARYNLNRRTFASSEVKIEQAIQVLQTRLPSVIDNRVALNLGDDFAVAADGKKSMKFYDVASHSMTADAPVLILSSFAKAYKRSGVEELMAEVMAGNKLVLENAGHALRLVESCQIGNAADSDIARWNLLQGHEHVFVFASADGSTLSYIVVDGPDFTEYSLADNLHRDLAGHLYIKSSTMSRHMINQSEQQRLDDMNAFLISKGLNTVNERPMNKFEMAVFMKTGFSLICNIGFGKVADEAGQNERWMTSPEFQKALVAGFGEAKSKLSHIERGYQGQLGQELGLKAADFKAAREFLAHNG